MALDVSVVIPFFNPGADLDDCVASMRDQTLAADRFEVILVDDGSTDGSSARADAWAARLPRLVTVQHIEASGGPARPRNLGIDTARGRYVQFVDSDDALAPRALERQLEVADASAADVVVGKLASDFRGIYHPLFRKTVTGRTLADYPLIQNVTVCKMFRRDFLLEHGIRFPEGPHYIEDQQICIQAYAHAKSVAVVGDIACYYYRRRRTGGHNHGDTRIDPGAYFRELAAILEVIDTQVEPAARTSARLRYYRNEMLGRLRGEAMLRYDDGYRRDIAREVRALATTRMPPEVHESLPMFLRVQSRLMLDGDIDGLVAFAAELETIRLTARTGTPRWQAGRLHLALDAYLRRGDEPLQLEQNGEGWALPAAMAPGVPIADRRLHTVEDVDIDLATISRADAQLWSTTEGLSLSLDDGCPRVRSAAAVDPWHVMGGGALTAGLWDLRLRLMFAGLTRTSALRPLDDEPPTVGAWLATVDDEHRSVAAYWTHPSPTLALDVDAWLHPLHDLVDDPRAVAPTARRRRVELSAQDLHGEVGKTRPARVVLTPAGASTIPTLTCEAAVECGPEGSTVRSTVPRLPKPAASETAWRLWVSLDRPGGAPPRPLPLTLTPAGWRGVAVSVEEPADTSVDHDTT